MGVEDTKGICFIIGYHLLPSLSPNFVRDKSRHFTDFNFFALYGHYMYQSKAISFEVKILSDLYP
jgi:hypothetical protein